MTDKDRQTLVNTRFLRQQSSELLASRPQRADDAPDAPDPSDPTPPVDVPVEPDVPDVPDAPASGAPAPVEIPTLPEQTRSNAQWVDRSDEDLRAQAQISRRALDRAVQDGDAFPSYVARATANIASMESELRYREAGNRQRSNPAFAEYSIDDLDWEIQNNNRRITQIRERESTDGRVDELDASRLIQLPKRNEELQRELDYRRTAPPQDDAPGAPTHDAFEFADIWGDRAEEIVSSPAPSMDDLNRVLTEGTQEDRARYKQMIEDAYNGENGLGTKSYKMQITQLRIQGGADRATVRMNAEIRDADGNYLGTMERSFIYGDASRPGHVTEVHNDLLRINSEAQGTGMARDLYRRQENWFIRDGVDKITIHANIDVGGYAWARAGFLWDPNQPSASTTVDNMLSRLRRPYGRLADLDQTDLDDARTYLQKVMADNAGKPATAWPTPFELSQIGYTEGATTWPGKELMLGMSWMAVKYLGAPEAQALPGQSALAINSRVSVTRNGATITGTVTLVDPETGRIMMRRDAGGVTQFDPNEDGTTITPISS